MWQTAPPGALNQQSVKGRSIFTPACLVKLTLIDHFPKHVEIAVKSSVKQWLLLTRLPWKVPQLWNNSWKKLTFSERKKCDSCSRMVSAQKKSWKSIWIAFLFCPDSGFVMLQGTTYWTDLFVRHFLFQNDSTIDCDDLLFFVRKKHVKGSPRYLPKFEVSHWKIVGLAPKLVLTIYYNITNWRKPWGS